MDEQNQVEGHHDNLKVNFDILRHVGACYCCWQSIHTEQLKQTKCIKDICGAASAACEGAKRHTRDKVDEEGAFQICDSDDVGVSDFDTLFWIQVGGPEPDYDINEEE